MVMQIYEEKINNFEWINIIAREWILIFNPNSFPKRSHSLELALLRSRNTNLKVQPSNGQAGQGLPDLDEIVKADLNFLT